MFNKKNIKVCVTLFSLMLIVLINQVSAAKGMNKEVTVIALTILAEARGEGEAGMYAVGAVISQRAIQRKQTPTEVCLARKQFSCWNGKSVNDLKHLLDIPQAEYAISVARNIKSLRRDYVGYADHYHATWMKKKPYWAKSYKPVKRIGQHLFYTSK